MKRRFLITRKLAEISESNRNGTSLKIIIVLSIVHFYDDKHSFNLNKFLAHFEDR